MSGQEERGRRGVICRCLRSARRDALRCRAPVTGRGKGSGWQRTRLLPAGRRQQAPPGGVQESGVGIGWREYGRAAASELFRKALLAGRAATRRCRASTRSSHAGPLRCLPLVSWSLAALFSGAVEHSKVIPNWLAGIRLVDGPKTRSYAKCLARWRERRSALGLRRTWQSPSLPMQEGCETRPVY